MDTATDGAMSRAQPASVSDARQGWTDARRARVIELWPDWTISAPVIAADVGGGLSKDAIIGFANRCIRKGVLMPRTRQKYVADKSATPPKAYRRRIVRRVSPRKFEPAPVEPARPGVYYFELDMPRLTIWEMTDTSCRWPLDDPPEDWPVQTYCGLAHKSGSSYCPYHHGMAWTGIPQRKHGGFFRMPR